MTKWTITDRGRKAESILAENPFDVDAWGVLLREAQVSYFSSYKYFNFFLGLYIHNAVLSS